MSLTFVNCFITLHASLKSHKCYQVIAHTFLNRKFQNRSQRITTKGAAGIGRVLVLGLLTPAYSDVGRDVPVNQCALEPASAKQWIVPGNGMHPASTFPGCAQVHSLQVSQSARPCEPSLLPPQDDSSVMFSAVD